MNNIKYIKIPNICPICGKPLKIQISNNTTNLICNNDDCKGKLLYKLCNFVSKDGFDIEGLSESTLQKFIDMGFINNCIDIFKLSNYKEDILRINGFGEKSFKKLFNSIEQSRNINLENFIYALNIELIGKTASKQISKLCNNNIQEFHKKINDRCDFSKEIDGFGIVMNNNISSWFEKTYNYRLYLDLLQLVQFNKNTTCETSNKFSNINFCITGSLNYFTNREALVKYIENNGGKTMTDVNKKTNYLINNDINSSSSKNIKAKKLGISIITEKELLELK